MPPRSRPICEVCNEAESKYACSKLTCRANYCSVACYKQHKGTIVPANTSTSQLEGRTPSSPHPLQLQSALPIEDPRPLRPLTSLNWPYVPEESAYPDPLKRDDPKPLQLHQYEAIATSPAIRNAIKSHPQLVGLLTNIDKLRGAEREEALQRALGVDSRQLKNDVSRPLELDEDTRALRALAEAVEGAVRGGKEGTLGLDWDD
ncbi:hypothetical protein PAXRUDRAFT_150840 [Paxillus rubicundulus Ve08.2h10]|uniref:HIT-type domain-containing protein n=1 Tax=Paxillus rubicundulus Ve08.2h10 TaxID=930991 RepID=A0A0D0DIR0_9AGAM|nr:hypothetical protein PAXRUDRAFT_150840 [Paxillus rubicundulus Ve08.2h10]